VPLSANFGNCGSYFLGCNVTTTQPLNTSKFMGRHNKTAVITSTLNAYRFQGSTQCTVFSKKKKNSIPFPPVRYFRVDGRIILKSILK
jgi:hypothetical protein